MTKYIAVSQMTKVNNFDYIYFFKEENALKVFREINPNAKVCLLDEIQNGEIFIGNKDVYYIYILPFLFKKGIKKVYVYNIKKFPKIEVKKFLLPKYIGYEKFVIFNKESDILSIHDLFNYNKKYIFVSNYLSNKDVISSAIKHIRDDIKIILFGKTNTPIKDLMTNSVDCLLNKDEISEKIEVLQYNEYFEVEKKCLVL